VKSARRSGLALLTKNRVFTQAGPNSDIGNTEAVGSCRPYPLRQHKTRSSSHSEDPSRLWWSSAVPVVENNIPSMGMYSALEVDFVVFATNDLHETQQLDQVVAESFP
jgi:hypothetical protein